MRKKLYTIGNVAKKAMISTRTLRYYEKLGLIEPDFVGDNSYRYYEEDTILKLTIIKYFKLIGFSLEEIKAQLISQDVNKMIATFDKILARSDIDIEEIIQRKEIVNDWKDLLEESKMLEFHKIEDVNVRYMAEKNLISFPFVFDFDYKSSILNLEFSSFINKKNNTISGPVMFYFDDINKRISSEDKNDKISANYIQKAVKKIDSDLNFHLEPNFCACLYYYGSYDSLYLSYKKLMDWQKKSSYKFIGPVIERFVFDYWTSFDEEKFITELIVPIEKLG